MFNEQYQKGFIALTAVLVIASVSLALALLNANTASDIVEQVNKKEYRMMSRWYARSCIDMVALTLAHDYFFSISTSTPALNCEILSVSGPSAGELRMVDVLGKYAGVKAEMKGEIEVTDNFIRILSPIL